VPGVPLIRPKGILVPVDQISLWAKTLANPCGQL
jgi:hypothetical protein